MERIPHFVRASALAAALASLLAVATPYTAGLAGARVVEGVDASIAVPGGAPTSIGPATNEAARRGPIDEERDSAGDAVERARTAPAPHVLLPVPAGGLVARKNPWSSADTVGRVADRSRYYGVPTVAWVEEVSKSGAWGRIELPYVWPRRDGWVRLDGLPTDTSAVTVKVDVSAHRLTAWKRGEVVLRVAAATGLSSSPTPPGEYFVTDRVPFAGGSSYGTFAFGISGIQPRLPAGWTGGDQLAIHGTNAPSTIGTNASAGCVRVSEWTLDRLKPMLKLGTPVVIVP